MLQFAGVNLLLPDPDGQLQAWVDRYLPLDDMRAFGAPMVGSRIATESRGRNARTNLPRMPWPEPPPLRLNQLYWPTGATRHAVGLFLATETGARAMLDRVEEGGQGTLILDAEGSGGVQPLSGAERLELTMHLLPPRPIAASPNGLGAYLLILVDERYFWPMRPGPDFEVDKDTLWTDLVDALGTALDVDIQVPDGISPDWLQPDPREWSRRHDDPAALLDALAASIGRRVVRRLNGDVLLAAPDRDAVATALKDAKLSKVAGGETLDLLDAALPYGVRVYYPRYRDGLPQFDGEHWTVTKNGVEYHDRGSHEGNYVMLYSTALADFSGHPQPETADNEAELDDLANKLAEAWYGWAAELPYDVTLSGFYDWTLTGHDDALLIDCGVLVGVDVAAGGLTPYHCATRVWSLPIDCYVDETLGQVEATDCIYDHSTVRHGVLDEDLNYDSYAAANRHKMNEDGEYEAVDGTDCQDRVHAGSMILQGYYLAANCPVLYGWDARQGLWYLIQARDCPQLIT